MIEEVNEFLNKEGWKTLSQWIWEMNINLPGRQLIINGRQMTEPGKQISLTIEFIGEGMLTNGEEKESIYGFKYKIPNENDIWCVDFEDFVFWYKQLIK